MKQFGLLLSIVGVSVCHSLLVLPSIYSAEPCCRESSSCGRLFTQINANDDNDDDVDDESVDDFVDMTQVSDAEALLACRAYLVRKNRLGWRNAVQRKEMRVQERESGFFWETPEQMVYRNKREEEDIDFDQDGDSNQTVVFTTNNNDGAEAVDGERNPLLLHETFGLFTEMPEGPTARSEIRSRVKKQQWDDPVFRARWYEARWGDHVKLTDATRKQRSIQRKLRNLSASLLESAQLTTMTEEEIDEAIKSYFVSNKKRAKVRKKQTKEDAKTILNEKENSFPNQKPLARDSLYATSEKSLREQQRQRSERAAKAYEKRIANQREVKVNASPAFISAKRSKVSIWKPDSQTPKDAAIRIVMDLDSNRLPSVRDIEFMMEATKLSRRKAILRRILNEQLDIRGKAVPLEDGSKIYVTQASVAQLGTFVIDTVKQVED